MGCLFFVVKTVLLMIELLFDSILDGWFLLMQWIIPEDKIHPRLRTALKILVGIFSILLFFLIFIGGIACLSDDPYTKTVGKYLLFIPLGISVVQIGLGVLIRYIKKNKC